MTRRYVTYLTRRMPSSVRDRLRLEAHRRRRLGEGHETMEDVVNEALAIGLYHLEARRLPHHTAHWDAVPDADEPTPTEATPSAPARVRWNGQEFADEP